MVCGGCACVVCVGECEFVCGWMWGLWGGVGVYVGRVWGLCGQGVVEGVLCVRKGVKFVGVCGCLCVGEDVWHLWGDVDVCVGMVGSV